MLIFQNLSQSWQSDEIDEEDTPYSGVLLIGQPSSDLANPKTASYVHVDAVIIDIDDTANLNGAKVLWDNHEWQLTYHEFDGDGTCRIWIERPNPRRQ